MNIGLTREALDARACDERRHAQLLEMASGHLRVLDGLLKAILEQAGEVEVVAPFGTTKTTCLDLVGRYGGLRLRHNGQTLTIADTTEQP